MTNSEAREELYKLYTGTYSDTEYIDFKCFEIAIKTLEENDKLKAEIEEYKKRLDAKETILVLQETTNSMLSSDKDMLIDEVNSKNKEIEQLKAELEQSVKLPCKVGDKVFFIKSMFSYSKSPMEGMVCMLKTFTNKGTFTFGVIMDSNNQERSFVNSDIGKTVFLTHKEAEQALKGGVV